MSTNPFEVFRTQDDYLNVSSYEQQNEIIDFSQVNRDRVRKAISYLKSVLGEDFLRRAFSARSSLFSMFLNAAPRARLEVAILAERLCGLETIPNFAGLVSRICDHRADEALTVLETAARFSRSGFNVSLDPRVHVTTPNGMREKVPDLRLLNPATGEEIFVEVSRLRPSDQQRKSRRAFLAISNMVDSIKYLVPGALDDIAAPKWIRVHVRILRILEQDELDVVLSKMKELAIEVVTHNVYRELILEGLVEMAMSPHQDHSRAKEWAAARGVKEFVESPLIPLNDIARVQGKIFEKMQQLPKDKPGVLLITTDENLLFFVNPLADIIEGVSERIVRFPHLFAVVLTHAFIAGQAESLAWQIGPHQYIRGTSETFVTEQSLVVRSAECSISVSDETNERLKAAFWIRERNGAPL